MNGLWWEPYVATWRRHRVWFLVPVVIAVLVAGWSVVGAPKSYMSQVSLWVDNPASEGSSLDALNAQATPPSTQEQTVLDELLTTERFVMNVAAGSSLESYLASHPREGFSPSALLSGLSGGSGPSVAKIESALGDNVLTAVPGPNVLAISYTGPTPQVARSTLSSLITELESASAKYSEVYSQSEASYYRSEYDEAQQAMITARAQASEYLAQHPGATGQNNPAYAALLTQEAQADAQVGTLSTNLREAQGAGSSNAAVVQEVDPPTLPTSATSGKKADAEGILGGLIAGIVVSLLAIALLTKREDVRARLRSGGGPDGETADRARSARTNDPDGAAADQAVRPLKRSVALRNRRDDADQTAERKAVSIPSRTPR